MRSIIRVTLLSSLLLLAVAPATARAVFVDLSTFPADGTPVPESTVLSEQWSEIGILFSARTYTSEAIAPIMATFGTGTPHLFFSPDLQGAVAVFTFVEPGTSTPIDATQFSMVPYFDPGEDAQLVGLDELGAVVAQDDVVDAPGGDSPMSIAGRFRTVEWRTQGNPGIATKFIEFETGGLCAAAPVAGCVVAAKGGLSISEKKPGKEKLAAVLQGFDTETTQASFGDPVGGDTRYDVCLYDGSDALVAELIVSRAGQLCAPKDKPCWKVKKGTGWTYKDPAANAAGVKSLAVVGGAAGKGKLTLKGSARGAFGETTLPTGIAAALEGATGARLQVIANGASCFDVVLGTVKKADGVVVKAKAP